MRFLCRLLENIVRHCHLVADLSSELNEAFWHTVGEIYTRYDRSITYLESSSVHVLRLKKDGQKTITKGRCWLIINVYDACKLGH